MKKILLFLTVAILFFGVSHYPLADAAVTLNNPLGYDSFPALITAITGYIAGIVASLATIMFVYSGILFVTSAGNPGRIQKAQQAAIYAVIGVGVALAATGLIGVIGAVVGG